MRKGMEKRGGGEVWVSRAIRKEPNQKGVFKSSDNDIGQKGKRSMKQER